MKLKETMETKMPNYCSNIVTFTHDDPAMIQKVEDSFKTEPGLFSGFIPTPDDEDSLSLRIWCIQNWGTKWDVSTSDGNFIDDKTDHCIRLYFDTPWSPPIEFYQTMLNMGFNVSAYYFEPGMGFVGSWEDGDDECYEGFAGKIDEMVPSHLVDMFNIHDWFDSEDEDIEEDTITNKE